MGPLGTESKHSASKLKKKKSSTSMPLHQCRMYHVPYMGLLYFRPKRPVRWTVTFKLFSFHNSSIYTESISTKFEEIAKKNSHNVRDQVGTSSHKLNRGSKCKEGKFRSKWSVSATSSEPKFNRFIHLYMVGGGRKITVSENKQFYLQRALNGSTQKCKL